MDNKNKWKRDSYEYIRQRLILSNGLLETISTAVSQNLGDKYLGKYMREINPHIIQAVDDKYQSQQYEDTDCDLLGIRGENK